MTAAAALSPSREIRFERILYTVAVAGTRVIYIATSDPAFRTPDGFSTSTTLGDLRSNGLTELGEEIGWAFYTELPSGWCAGFSPLAPKETLVADTKIAWFFKRS